MKVPDDVRDPRFLRFHLELPHHVGKLLGGADIGDGHGQKLLDRPAVLLHGCVVDGQEPERLDIVDPHRMRVAFEEIAIPSLRRAQRLLGHFAHSLVFEKPDRRESVRQRDVARVHQQVESRTVRSHADRLERPRQNLTAGSSPDPIHHIPALAQLDEARYLRHPKVGVPDREHRPHCLIEKQDLAVPGYGHAGR